MRGVQPCDAPAPAEAGNEEALRIALRALYSPLGGSIQVAHHLRVGYLVDYTFGDFLVVLNFGNVTLARVEVRCNRHISRGGKAAADIADMLVHAEDFVDH